MLHAVRAADGDVHAAHGLQVVMFNEATGRFPGALWAQQRVGFIPVQRGSVFPPVTTLSFYYNLYLGGADRVDVLRDPCEWLPAHDVLR